MKVMLGAAALTLTTTGCIYNATRNAWLAGATLSICAFVLLLTLLLLAEIESVAKLLASRTQEEE